MFKILGGHPINNCIHYIASYQVAGGGGLGVLKKLY